MSSEVAPRIRCPFPRRKHAACWVWMALTSLALLTPTRSFGQACCASGASLTPVRLDLHERVLAGLQVGAFDQHGSFDTAARYRETPTEASDLELRGVLFGTFAPSRRVQLSVLAPWVETRRVAARTPPEWGGGLGDVAAAARFEPVQLREYGAAPSVALLGTLTAPTGTPPEQAKNLLGSDSTGAGVWRLGGGLALEKAHSAFLFNLTSSLSTALSRTADGVHYTYGLRLDTSLAVGYAVTHYWNTALALAHEVEGAPESNGVKGVGRRRIDASLIVTHSLDDGLRLQGSVTLTPPLSGLGRNEIARAGGTLTVVKSWL